LTGASKIKLAGLSAGNHTISIVGAQDLAGNFLPDFSVSVNVTSDTTAPTLTSLTAEGNKIRVKFSEPLVDVNLSTTTGNPADTAVRFALSDGAGNFVVGTAADAVDENETEYLVDASAFVTGGATWKNVPVVLKAGSQDASGNAIASDSTAKNLIISLDQEAPTLVSATAVGDKIVLKFNEAVQAGATPISAANIKLVTTDGVVIDEPSATIGTVAYKYDANNNGSDTDAGENQYVVIPVTDTDLVANSKLKAGSYTLTLPVDAIADTAGNDNTTAIKATFTVAGDSSTTNDLTATPTEVAPGVLEFAFDANLTNAALDRTKYTINGAELPEGTKLYFYGDKQHVRAELPANYITVTGNRTLAVKDIVDENGNTLDDASLAGTVVSLTENVQPVAQSAALSTNKVLFVEMSEAIANPATATGIEVWVNGSKVSASDLAFGRAAGSKGANTRLTITATAFEFAPTQNIVVKFVEGTTLADTQGNVAATGQVTVSNN
jgi:hypothetical protein